ncbi:MAG: outer membrane beta-barrel protein [Candidatus Aminicenantales bacterium]
MKRAAFLIAGLILINSFVQSFPGVEVRLLGSFQFSRFSVASPGAASSSSQSPRPAGSVGMGFCLPLSQKFALETDFLYRQKKSELTRFSGLAWSGTYYRLRCLAVPLLAHFRFPVSRIQVILTFGAEASWVLGSRFEDRKIGLTISPIPGLKSFDLQAVGGAGIRYSRVSVEFRYEYGLLNLSKDRDSGLSIKSRGFEFLVAFRLLKKNRVDI